MDEAENKSIKKIPNRWAWIISSFLVISKCLDWRIGDGKKINTGLDPWIKGSHFKLPNFLVTTLRVKGIFTFDQLYIQDYRDINDQIWKKSSSIGITGTMVNEWEVSDRV